MAAATTFTTTAAAAALPFSFPKSKFKDVLLLPVPPGTLSAFAATRSPQCWTRNTRPMAAEADSYSSVSFSSDKPRVIGVVGDVDAAGLCYLGLQKLQHRGEKGKASDSSSLRSVTGLGLVADVFTNPSLLSSLTGPAAIGHVGYSTAGAAASASNPQPLLSSYPFGQLAVAHNGNLVNYRLLRSQLESRGSIFNTSSDTEVILHLIATSTARPLLSRIVEACEALEGAYSLLFLTAQKLFAVRDPFGFCPLVMGRRPNGAISFTSETCALDLIDATYEREVEPGEVVVVDLRDMSVSSACLMPRKASILERIYFALPDSILFGRAVHDSRSAFGRALTEESHVPGADVVIPVPDSGFSQAAGIPFQQELLGSHYVGRTLIQPSQHIWDLGAIGHVRYSTAGSSAGNRSCQLDITHQGGRPQLHSHRLSNLMPFINFGLLVVVNLMALASIYKPAAVHLKQIISIGDEIKPAKVSFPKHNQTMVDVAAMLIGHFKPEWKAIIVLMLNICRFFFPLK